MEQGRIDAVLSANRSRGGRSSRKRPHRRFKLQKKEALRKLERTDQNLARVTDLLEERARRIRSLRIQAGRARRWQELHATLRDLRAALAVVDGRRCASRLPASRRSSPSCRRGCLRSRVRAAKRRRCWPPATRRSVPRRRRSRACSRSCSAARAN